MDRAHRLGQKRTVNVYRLLTRDSLEDKIMGLQRFKLDVANSVVNQDNVSLKTMDAGRLLDLFTLEKNDKAAGNPIAILHSPTPPPPSIPMQLAIPPARDFVAYGSVLVLCVLPVLVLAAGAN